MIHRASPAYVTFLMCMWLKNSFPVVLNITRRREKSRYHEESSSIYISRYSGCATWCTVGAPVMHNAKSRMYIRIADIYRVFVVYKTDEGRGERERKSRRCRPRRDIRRMPGASSALFETGYRQCEDVRKRITHRIYTYTYTHTCRRATRGAMNSKKSSLTRVTDSSRREHPV